MTTELIPFQVETRRVLEIMAKQIYQSPLALLRENVQNAYDAIRVRMHNENMEGNEPRIDVTLTRDRIIIADTGVGMTPDDLRNHYWRAGSSSKNTEAARMAGVVGTFGIGAMSNFGIADELTVETESSTTGERSLSRAVIEKISLNEDCIELTRLSPTGQPGTTVTAHIRPEEEINIDQAKRYISEFVSLLTIPVRVNGEMVSGYPIDGLVPSPPGARLIIEAKTEQLGPRLRALVTLAVSNNADIWISVENLVWSDLIVPGKLVLRSGQSALRTFRSGFGLATVTVASHYSFGGVADMLLLAPTAGREALTTEAMQLLQSMMTEIDTYASERLAPLRESDASTPFMLWAVAHSRYDLCGELRMIVKPGDEISLREIQEKTKKTSMMLYGGSDQEIIRLHATEDQPLLVLARQNPRRKCEQNFLSKFCNTVAVSEAPVVEKRKGKRDWSNGEIALAYRIETVLDTDYFLRSTVIFGKISHNLPILVEKVSDGVLLTLDSDAATVRLVLGLYETEFNAFGSMTKDFIRTTIFPRISEFVPSSTKQGAEAFLRAIRRPRDTFEYEDTDLGSLPKIWSDYSDGQITMDQAVQRSLVAVRTSVQVVDATASARVNDVVPDVIPNEQAIGEQPSNEGLSLYDAAPAITRSDTSTNAKLLVIEDGDPPLRGYRCFLALTDRVREEFGDFFFQPHMTTVVWGGQRALFVFMHHSGQFGLYYDLQTTEAIKAQSGGGSCQTCSIILKDRIFIPVPEQLRSSFVPGPGERKRFEVKGDILSAET